MRKPVRRSRPSTIDRLDPEIKDLIGKLRIDFGWTIDEILKRLRDLGQTDVSRSALGRHVLSIEAIGAQMREARELALALRPAAGDEDEVRTADLNHELLHGAILRLTTRVRDDDDGESAAEVKALAQALRDLSSAKKTDADRIVKIRAEAAKKAKDEAVKAVEAVGTEGGFTKETVELFKRRILAVPA